MAIDRETRTRSRFRRCKVEREFFLSFLIFFKRASHVVSSSIRKMVQFSMHSAPPRKVSPRKATGESAPHNYGRSKSIRGKTAPPRATNNSASMSPSASPTTQRGSQEWLWPLPPTTSRPTKLERYGPTLWGLTQPFYPSPASSFSAENRMTVHALPPRVEGGGGETTIDLWLHNPLPPTDELVSHLQSIKETLVSEAASSAAATTTTPKVSVRVAHLVVPSSSPEHWSAAADALDRLGEKDSSTSLWVPPNFFDGGRLLGSVIKVKGEGGGRGGGDRIDALRPRSTFLERGDAQERFSSDVSVAGVVGGGLGLFTEFVFHLRSAKAVVTADSAFCLSDADAAVAREAGTAGALDFFLARLVGISGKLGSPVGVALASAPGGQGKRFAEDVTRWCDSGEVERVVSCHLSAPVEDDAAGQLKKVFAFLL